MAFALIISTFGLQLGQVATAPQAAAAPGPIMDRRDVTADPLPTVQINGVVWRQQVVGNTVYVAGDFTSARPAGAAPGTNEVPRKNMLAYDLQTGVLKTGFAPTFNGKVRAMAVSPDGTKLYVGGAFTQVNGQTRNRIAAFDIATGNLLPFTASFNSTVNTIVATSSTVYVGGLFNYSGSNRRLSLAALNPTTGGLLSWAPETDGYVQAMVLTNDGSRLILGGNFTTVNGVEAKGTSSINIADGSTNPFALNQVIQNTGDAQSVLSLSIDSEGTVYGSAFAYGGPGPFFEGAFAADSMTGQVKWLADCHGDTYDAVRLGQAVYTVSHHHVCTNIGGFPDTNPRRFWQRGNAFSVEATGTVNPNSQGGYPNFGGQPAPSLLTWFPNVASGTYTGQTQGGWTLASTDQYLLMGGEFPTINGTKQEGLARFAVSSIAPKKVGPTLSGADTTPTASAFTPTRVRVRIPGNWDRDNYTLSYALYREGTATPVYTTSAQSVWWPLPSFSVDDNTVTAGQTYRYRVVTTDPDGNSVTSPWASVTVPSSIHAYPAQILADGASHYWRLGAAGNWPDYAGAMDLANVGTVTSQAGAIIADSDPATGFSGSASFGASTAREDGPQTFTAEAWFKTTSTSGGKIVGFGDANTGSSSNYDRHIYMQNDGRLTFGVYPGTVRVITSATAYNDGAWHHVAASLSSAGMRLYVDGQLVAQRADTTSAQVYSGAWRVGGDNLSSWTNRPNSDFLAGTVDEVAIYPTALSLSQVRDHYTKSGRTPAGPPQPTDAYGRAVFDDSPQLMWRLDESTGAAIDQTGNGWDGTVSGGVTRGSSSTVTTTGTGYTFDGVNGLVATGSAAQAPTVYSTELWFNTSSTGGGKLIGYGNSASGNSTSYDRHVYLEPDGRVTFGVWTGVSSTISTPTAYNDGKWHHMVATQGPGGMRLYLDGVQVASGSVTTAQDYTGYWRVGGDSPWSGNGYIAGSIDEVAVYGQVLSLDQVRAHYRAALADVNKAPTADFGFQCTTEGVCTFTSTATDPDGSVADGHWNFGDGSEAASGLTSEHTYAASGTYQVSFTAVDDQDAESAPVSKAVEVTVPPANVPPTADFTFNCVERSCTFTNKGADTDGTITGSVWDFGDGDTSTQTSPSHTFAANGTYHVKLTVTDNREGTDSVTKSVLAAAPNVPPTAAFDADVTNLKVTVDAGGSSDSDGTVESYAWDFGDGHTGTGKDASHTYAAAGTYTITLVVTDDANADSAPVTRQVTVAPAPNQDPQAAFDTSISGLSVSVDASDSDDPDGSITSYAWDFGDGETGTGKTASHTYSLAGAYTITLTVTDNDDATDAASKSVSVSAVVVSDNFNRTANNWGTANTGGTWTYNSSSYFSTDGEGGIVRLPNAGSRGTASLTGVSVRDVVLTAKLQVDSAITGAGVQSTYILRIDGNSDYRFTVQLHSDGQPRLNWTRRVDGTTTNLGDAKLTNLNIGTGDAVRIKVSVVGDGSTSLQAKVWADGTAEPSTWQLSRTDTTAALQGAGSFSVSHYAMGSATTLPLIVKLDDLVLTAV